MSRLTRRYLKPIDVADVALNPTEGARGRYTLTNGRTYRFIIGGAEAALQSVHLTGYTSGLVITTATIQTCDHAESEVTDSDTTVGHWINEDPPSPAFVAFDGTGWAAGATPSVITAAGSGVGGARWNLADNAATRTALTVVVGGTGGDVRVSCGGKLP